MDDLAALARATAGELATLFRAGKARPSDLAEHLLARIAETMDDHIFITVTAERARAEALASDRRHAAGRPLSALDGVPLVWKDLFDMAGTVTTAGSAVMARSAAATRDAEAVRRLTEAGMVNLGKVNTSEFAYSGLGLNPHFGTPRNPNDWATLRSPGGSSSGSGAAVAAGLTCCAIGTDTGGSIRVPAAFNGVVGLKTSTGRIDRTGTFPLSRTLDTIGPLARSVGDCALVFAHLADHAPAPIAPADLAGLTLICPSNLVLDDLDPAVARNLETSLAALETAGARILRRAVPQLSDMAALTARHGSLVAAEAYALYADLVDSAQGDEIDRRVTHRILGGKRMSARDLLAIQTGRLHLGQTLTAEMGPALLVMPTTPITAPPVAPLEADDTLFHRINLLALRNVSLINGLDLCALALSNGRDAGGLPTSLMLAAPHGADERLLALGMAVERALASALPGMRPAL